MRASFLFVIVYGLFFSMVLFAFNSCHEAKGFGLKEKLFSKKYTLADSVYYHALNRQFEANMSKYGCPGMAVAVIKDDHIIFDKGYGVRSLNTMEPIDQNTVFRIGSVSKGFAGMLASILIDQGKLHLDDPVSLYVPEMDIKAKNEDRVLRLRHILSHTSGYTEHAFSNLVDQGLDRATLVRCLSRIAPRDVTGIDYAYQNVAFSLVEQAIEKVTGMTYAQALDFYIFSPLNMCNSSSSYEAMNYCVNHCQGHIVTKNGIVPQDLGKHYYNIPSAGGVNATLNDMVKWLRAIMGYRPDVLSREARNLAFDAYADTSKDRKFWNRRKEVLHTQYGLGWRLVETNYNHLVYHGGLVNGFRSEIAFDSKTNTGIVVLFNSLCSYSNSVVFDFFEFNNHYFQESEDIYL